MRCRLNSGRGRYPSMGYESVGAFSVTTAMIRGILAYYGGRCETIRRAIFSCLFSALQETCLSQIVLPCIPSPGLQQQAYPFVSKFARFLHVRLTLLLLSQQAIIHRSYISPIVFHYCIIAVYGPHDARKYYIFLYHSVYFPMRAYRSQ